VATVGVIGLILSTYPPQHQGFGWLSRTSIYVRHCGDDANRKPNAMLNNYNGSTSLKTGQQFVTPYRQEHWTPFNKRPPHTL